MTDAISFNREPMLDLDEFRAEAAQALSEVVGLATKGATDEQVQLAAKFAVTAQARYSIACYAVAQDMWSFGAAAKHLGPLP